MAVTSLAYPKYTFTDANGKPLAGGLVYTYQAGTSTLATTWTDSSGSTANTNPVVLDVNGQCTIWGLTTQTYDFGVHNSGDVLQYTVQNISGTASYATFSASSGSALVGFLQAGTGAVARLSQDKLREFVSVKDFGAKGDGTTDDTAAIQAAIDYCNAATNAPTLWLPSGTYKITDSLFFGKKTDQNYYSIFSVQGAGKRFYPTARAEANYTGGTMIDASALTDRPALVVQGVRGGRFRGFTVLGSGRDQLYSQSLTALASTVSAWVPTGHTSGQYNPTCGIAIDPYSGTTPVGGYSAGITYGYVTSSACKFDDVGVSGFVVGFGLAINNQGFNCDSMRFENCLVNCNTYNFVVCGAQNRDIQYNNCVVTSAFTCWDTITFGTQNGDLGHIKGGIGGTSYQLFNIKLQYNNNSISNFYAESIQRIGSVPSINTAMCPGLQFRACQFKEETTYTAYNAKDPLFFPQGGGFVADGVLFMPVNPYACLHGTSGTASTLIPPKFSNCAFVSNQQSGQPNPAPYYRWWVGEFKNIATARPVFQDCRTDMWNGDSTNAASFIDSYNGCGDTLRWNSTTLPTRKEVVNYSATRLIDLNGKAYNLKNIGTYSQSTWVITAASSGWSGNTFTAVLTVSPTDFAVNDLVFYGDSSLPLVVTAINSGTNTLTTTAIFAPSYYTAATDYTAAGFRLTIARAQYVNSGAITGDISSGTNTILNCASATTAFKVGDWIGSSTGLLPTNTRITAISGTTITLNKNATGTLVGATIGDLICVAAA